MVNTVREVMTPDPLTAPVSTPVESVAELMRDHDVGSVPIVDDGQLAGVLTDRDIVVRCIAAGRHPAGTLAEEMCSGRDVHTVAPETSARDAAELMREHALRRLPVVEGGDLVGMVSIGDLAREQDPESPLADISTAPPNN